MSLLTSRTTSIIEYGYGRDQVGAVIVNGTELPANNASDRVDVGTLLKMGEKSPALPTTNDTDDTNPDGTWFDLQGRKFTGKPTQKGVYINNGKKRLKEGKR